MQGKDLTPEILVSAYSQGYFPMPKAENPDEVLWYRPDPRAVLDFAAFHASRSLLRRLRKEAHRVTLNDDFPRVMRECAAREETWITADFLRAYTELHTLGLAHSLEVWHGDTLWGGVYGVALRRAFFAESMFSHSTDGSKAALYYLTRHLEKRGFLLLEVQFLTPHLRSLGAREIPDPEYQKRLAAALSPD